MSAVPFLAAAAMAAAALAIFFDYRGPRLFVYIFKPLAVVLVIAVAAAGPRPFGAAYKAFILAGLAASLAGDVFMMLPVKRFTAGLAAFLVAHACYILAFRPGPGYPFSPTLLLPFLVLGLLIFRMLAPSLGGLKFPVLVYIAAITIMAWLAAVRFVDSGGAKPLAAFAGALLFLVSDGVLAYNRFVKPFGAAQLVILGAYFPAQLLIALSV